MPTTAAIAPVMESTLSDITQLSEMAARITPIAKLAEMAPRLAVEYQSARPFPHIAVDDLWDADVLRQIYADFPARGTDRNWLEWDTANERKQTSRGVDGLSPFTQLYLRQLCSNEFINQLKVITGIDDLLPDPLFYGAGLHETFTDGWLDIHGDYIRHPLLPLARRLNLLIYLNEDWNTDWAGELELWDPVTKTRAHSFAPIFNRTVLFTTTSDALHGSPAPLTCPRTRSRRMISVYYWSADEALLADSKRIEWTSTRKERLSPKAFIPPALGIIKRRLSDMLVKA